MENSESILAVSSFIFLTVLVVIAKLRAPNANFLDWYTGKKVEFDKAQLPNYARLVVGTIILSILYGFLIVPSAMIVSWFTVLNTGIAAITGINIFLYRSRKPEKDSKKR